MTRLAEGVELAEGACFAYDFPRHTHDEITLGRVMSGEEIVTIAGARDVVGAGGYYLTGSGLPHAGESRSGSSWTYQSIYIDPALVGEWGEQNSVAALHDSARCPRLDGLFNLLADPESEEDRLETVTALLAEFGAPSPGASMALGGRLARAARRLMLGRFREPTTISEVAEALSVRPSTMIGQFQRAYGMTPGRFLQSLRLQEAKRLLRTGSSPGAAAADAGYFDQSHFHRNFRRVMGVTPGEYRRLWQD